MPTYAPTSATLAGARDLNRMHRTVAQDDLGYKLERLMSAFSVFLSVVSAVNVLQSAVSQIHIALGSAATSMAGTSLWSAFSAYAAVASPGTVSTQTIITTVSAASNFRA